MYIFKIIWTGQFTFASHATMLDSNLRIHFENGMGWGWLCGAPVCLLWYVCVLCHTLHQAALLLQRVQIQESNGGLLPTTHTLTHPQHSQVFNEMPCENVDF